MTIDEAKNLFAYEHLKPELQDVSKPFHDMAMDIVNDPVGIATDVALLKLLEAKDAVVRLAAIRGKKV